MSTAAPSWLEPERQELSDLTDAEWPKCERCEKPRSQFHAFLCDRCAEEAEDDAAQSAPAPCERVLQPDEDLPTFLANMQAEFAKSPHRCAGGCGEVMLREGQRCDECHDRQRRQQAVMQAIGATISSLPSRYRWCRFQAQELASRVRLRSAIETARKAVDDDVDRVLLLGPAGAGKTVLACCILLAKVAKRASEDVFGGEFVDAFSLSVARAQAHLGEEPPILTRTLAASVLVVDDLGAEKDIHGSAVAEVIHERHANMRVTIITSGFSLQQLGARYGDGIGRRLGEGARIIDLGAK